MTRIEIKKTNKLGYAAIIGLEGYVRSTVDAELYELVKLRASVLNGCGFCVDMHASDGAKRGIPQRKLHAAAAWPHARSLFDEREIAALALTDAVTRLDTAGVDDATWAEAARHFDDGQLGALVLAIVAINAWNRIAIATGMEPPLDQANPMV